MQALRANARISGELFARAASLPAAKSRAIQRLGLPLIFVMIALVGYNLVIERTASSSQRRQLLARIETLPAETDCLFVGNSLVEAGCDIQSFAAGWPDAKSAPKAVNVALGAT